MHRQWQAVFIPVLNYWFAYKAFLQIYTHFGTELNQLLFCQIWCKESCCCAGFYLFHCLFLHLPENPTGRMHNVSSLQSVSLLPFCFVTLTCLFLCSSDIFLQTKVHPARQEQEKTAEATRPRLWWDTEQDGEEACWNAVCDTFTGTCDQDLCVVSAAVVGRKTHWGLRSPILHLAPVVFMSSSVYQGYLSALCVCVVFLTIPLLQHLNSPLWLKHDYQQQQCTGLLMEIF